jgi:AMP-binding enzyme
VVNVAIHRLIERQAASQGESLAYLDDTRALTYRELNHRANALARALIGSGFRRGSLAAVRMDRSAEFLVALLAVLKAGGAYLWTHERAAWPSGISIVERGSEREERFRALDVSRVLAEDCPPSANLPILTRGTDVACVMPDEGGQSDVLVPHATIAALQQQRANLRKIAWSVSSDVLDLWIGLMTGATITMTEAPVETVAA